MLGAIAQFETELRAERQMDGIRKARERGVHLGRHKRLTPQQIAALQLQRREGALIKTLMHDYRLSKASVYRYLAQRAHSNRKLRFQGFCRSIRLIERVFWSFYSTVRSDMQYWLAFSWPYNLLSDKVLRITVYSCANAPAGPRYRLCRKSSADGFASRYVRG